MLADGLRPVVIGQHLGVGSPPDQGVQRTVGVSGIEVVFEFLDKSVLRRAMFGAFVQYALDVGGQRDEPQEVLGEQRPADIARALGEDAAGRSEAHGVVLDLAELEDIQCFSDGEEVGHRHAQGVRERVKGEYRLVVTAAGVRVVTGSDALSAVGPQSRGCGQHVRQPY